MRIPFIERYRRHAEINEFLPDALAIRNAPLPWWANSGLLWLCCFFLVALLWSFLGEVDVIISAQGRIVSQSPPIELRPLERTVIKEIKIRVGDRVRQGQVLMTFDPVFNTTEELKLESELRKFSAQRRRLSAELERQEFLPQTFLNEERWQYSLYLTRGKLYRENMVSYEEEIARISQNLSDKKEQLILYQEMERLYLRTKGAMSLKEIKELQLSRMQIEYEISSLAKEKLALEAKRNAFMEEWDTKIVEELVQVQQDLLAAQKELEKIRQLQAYVSLYAPTDAIVHTIAPVPIGSAVREVESLVTLVPLHAELEGEVKIPTEYIGKVKNGNTARIKVTAFPFQKYGTIDGHVRYISGDAFMENAGGGLEPGKKFYYMSRIAIDKTSLTDDEEKEIFIIPGMEITCEIIVGKRRIIEYLLYPLIKYLDESMHEP